MRFLYWGVCLLSASAAAQNGFDLGDQRRAVLADPVRVVFQPSGAPPTMEAIQRALHIDGTQADWRTTSQTEGRAELVREVRGKHLVRVAADCDPQRCLLHYRESVNMLYGEKKVSGAALRVIHKNYNVWVHQLGLSLANRVGVSARVTDGFAAIDDADAVPYLRDGGRKGYREFLERQKPRVFVIAENGAWGLAGPRGQLSYAQMRNFDPIGGALERCSEHSKGAPCKLYAIDDAVVWPVP